MGRALVLKNVNFATNKVDTVSFGEEVPCTGIALSQNAIELTSFTPVTLTATLTPSNTTDTLTWASSDETVATVDDGVVTCVGIGTATITAVCGNQSATCSVAVTSIVLPESGLLYILHKQNSGTNLDASPVKDYGGSYGQESGNDLKRVVYFSPTVTKSGYKCLTGNNELYYGKYPIMIPPNAEHIIIEGTNDHALSSTLITYMDSTKEPTYSISDKGCRAVSNITQKTASQNKATYDIPTDVAGLDSFYVTCTFTESIEDSPEGLTITFT